MSEKTEKPILDLIKQHYRPYDTHEEFRRGSAYQVGCFRNPHMPGSIAAQAWDCGAKAAMHYAIATAA